jgi:hypothetical protein
MAKKCRQKMLIKINIWSVIFSLHFVLILIDKVRIAQIYEYFKMVNKCRQKMLIKINIFGLIFSQHIVLILIV